MSYADRLRTTNLQAGRDADAEIAALTERLRAVRAESGNLAHANKENGDYILELESQLSDLRAELERKDAALKEERKYHEERIDVSAGLTLANHKNAITRIDMALQPKEPPCQTA